MCWISIPLYNKTSNVGVDLYRLVNSTIAMPQVGCARFRRAKEILSVTKLVCSFVRFLVNVVSVVWVGLKTTEDRVLAKPA